MSQNSFEQKMASYIQEDIGPCKCLKVQECLKCPCLQIEESYVCGIDKHTAPLISDVQLTFVERLAQKREALYSECPLPDYNLPYFTGAIYSDDNYVIEFVQDSRINLIFMNTGEIIQSWGDYKYLSKHPKTKELNRLYGLRRIIDRAIKEIRGSEKRVQ